MDLAQFLLWTDAAMLAVSVLVFAAAALYEAHRAQREKIERRLKSAPVRVTIWQGGDRQ